MKRLIAGLTLALLIVSPVSAAPPAPTGTINLTTADPNFGEIVTFTVTVTKKLDCVGHAGCARVLVECYQGGDLVYGEAGDIGQARGDGTSPLGYVGFLLGGGGSVWIDNGGGPADCVATLFHFDQVQGQQTFVTLATTTFHAEA